MLSVIICTYNRDAYIYDALIHLKNNSFSYNDYEIVLVDNNSTDNTSSLCHEFELKYPEVRFRYFLETNQGLSYARNRGILESQGEYVIFLDDDAFVAEDYLQNTFDLLTKYPETDAWGGKITPRFESGTPPKWWGSRWTKSWVSAIDLGDKIKKFSRGQYPIGANMGFSKKILSEIGDFDTRLGRTKKNLIGGEEKDIFNRLYAAGGMVYWFPGLEVEHIIPESRTTEQYIDRLALGVGSSERMRTLSISNMTFYKRVLSEFVKWCVSLILWGIYICTGNRVLANMLVRFRWNVSKGLLVDKSSIDKN